MINKKTLHLLLGACSLALMLLSLATVSAFAAIKPITAVEQTICIEGGIVPTGEVILAKEYDENYQQSCPQAHLLGPNVEIIGPGPTSGQDQQICIGSPIPVNDVIVYASLSPPPPLDLGSGNLLSSCTYVHYVITPVLGNAMQICQISPIPRGYVQDGKPFMVSNGCPLAGPMTLTSPVTNSIWIRQTISDSSTRV